MKRLVQIFLSTVLLSSPLWAATITGQVRLPGPPPFTGVAGVKVVLTAGISTDPHVDSAVSDSIGNYVMSTNVIHGAHTFKTSKSGYNGSVNLVNIPTDSSYVFYNPIISVNNKTSSFIGVVKRASDSSIVIGATVTLTGGPTPGVTLTKSTDSTGTYRFDSVSTGGAYVITVTIPNYVSAQIGGLVAGWNSTANAPTIYLTQNLGRLAGVVTNNSTGNPIAGAKLVFSVGTTKVDSTTTDGSGQFILTLNASTYTVTISAVGFNDSLGHKTRTLTATFNYRITTYLNTTLTPATSQISGTVHQNSLTGVGLAGAKVVLQRRVGTAAAYYTLDSTLTDPSGIFLFSNLVATVGTGFGTGAQAPNYRLQSGKTSGTITWGASLTNPAPANTILTAANVTVGGTFTVNIALFCCADAIAPFSSATPHDIHFTTLGDHLLLDLMASSASRTIEVVDLKGKIQHRVDVASGETRVFVPAAYAPEKGFLFLVK